MTRSLEIISGETAIFTKPGAREYVEQGPSQAPQVAVSPGTVTGKLAAAVAGDPAIPFLHAHPIDHPACACTQARCKNEQL